jgi:hypothetical protein
VPRLRSRRLVPLIAHALLDGASVLIGMLHSSAGA